jgi:GntR family transcriptional regulator
MPAKDKSPVLRIDLRGPTPVYRQIVDGLRAMLVGGAFKPGDKLPPVRQLAIDLNVNHNTVAGAYRLLAEEGWLDLKRHHGATVLARSRQRAGAQRHDDFAQRLEELAALAIADGIDRQAIADRLNLLACQLNQTKKGSP